MTDLVVINEIRISECDICIDNEASMLNVLQKKGVDASFQWTGEIDEKGCKIMELLPTGNWIFYRDIANAEYVFSRNTKW